MIKHIINHSVESVSGKVESKLKPDHEWHFLDCHNKHVFGIRTRLNQPAIFTANTLTKAVCPTCQSNNTKKVRG